MDKQSEFENLLNESQRDAMFRRKIILMLMDMDASEKQEKYQKKAQILKQQIKNFPYLTQEEVIEMLSSSRGGSLNEQIDRVFFISTNYKKITELMNKQAIFELRREVKYCDMRIKQMEAKRNQIKSGRAIIS